MAWALRKSLVASAGGACVVSLLFACSSCPVPHGTPFTRDWARFPAVALVDVDTAGTTFAVSDIHGGYDRFIALLAKHGVIAAAPAGPTDVRWAAGTATLVVVGDLIDKGPDGLDVIDAVMSLEASAAQAGGRVVTTLGNHEAEFLDDPRNAKAVKKDGLDAELAREGVDPDKLASGADPRGAWLRTLPLAARIGRWFFAHAGNTGGASVADLEKELESGFAADGFRATAVTGTHSILEDHGWADDHALIASEAAALGVDHIVVGHDPGAYGPRGEIAVVGDGALFRIRADAGVQVAESLHADGTVDVLWREHRCRDLTVERSDPWPQPAPAPYSARTRRDRRRR